MTASESHSNRLVEHFFRHEYANLVSVLSKTFGFARIDLIEDTVSAAMLRAMDAWKQGGVPDKPAAWIHRVARNRILDTLRREKTHQQAMAFVGLDETTVDAGLTDIEAAIPDSLLGMMFVCCHPTLDRQSQIALTLKILCGFSVHEIARGLLTTPEATKKRIQRAKVKLQTAQIGVELPPAEQLSARLDGVHEVLYLMFNEGYSTSHGIAPIRDNVCEEAARLCHLLCEHDTLSTPESQALLALMLFHASRLDARVDALGQTVLLDDQDRSKWDHRLIQVADGWLVRSVQDRPSRFHLEAVIAQFHCAAPSFAETDWDSIVKFYDRLLEGHPSPVYRLNRAIAVAHAGQPEEALVALQQLRDARELDNYYLLTCALGHVHQLAG
ncbi:MAG: sigma-70 family RNA polymerase sigma factor, partial [Planctomycetota bacterium]